MSCQIDFTPTTISLHTLFLKRGVTKQVKVIIAARAPSTLQSGREIALRLQPNLIGSFCACLIRSYRLQYCFEKSGLELWGHYRCRHGRRSLDISILTDVSFGRHGPQETGKWAVSPSAETFTTGYLLYVLFGETRDPLRQQNFANLCNPDSTRPLHEPRV